MLIIQIRLHTQVIILNSKHVPPKNTSWMWMFNVLFVTRKGFTLINQSQGATLQEQRTMQDTTYSKGFATLNQGQVSGTSLYSLL